VKKRIKKGEKKGTKINLTPRRLLHTSAGGLKKLRKEKEGAEKTNSRTRRRWKEEFYLVRRGGKLKLGAR